MNPEDWTETPAEPTPAGFCQHCGKPLTPETIRVVGPAVYCEPCLQDRLNNPSAPNPGPRPSAPADSVWQWGAGMPSGWTPGTGPNPGLAAVLGFIPGVGAMYNEQYAKGIFHLLVFAVLISLSHSSGLFGLMAFGWICYMVIEAHHTARARRDGTPLPNPFGLNDLGERLGFGRSWPSPAGAVPQNPAPPPTASQPYPPPPAAGTVPPATPWGAPSDAYAAPRYTQPYAAPFAQPFPPGYGPAAPPIPPFPSTPPYGAPFEPIASAPVPPTPVADPPYVPPPSRFPAGAVWLIGLGTLFLLSTTGIFQVVFGWSLVGFVLIALAVWIFLRRMMDTGPTLIDDGAPNYLLRVVRALGPSVWVFTIGVLLLLDAFHLIPWHRSWPIFIILAGAMALLQRAAHNAAAAPYYPQPLAAAPHPAPPETSLQLHRNGLAPLDDAPHSPEGGN